MLKFFYNPKFKYSNRTIIDFSSETNFREIDFVNIDSPDTINGHIIYQLMAGETLPTYIYDTDTTWRWFVSGITQLRTGKYQISLLRDVISENPNQWKNEDAYISAGLANDFNKYKRWNLPFTNTKVKEQRLPINGKSSFFVYYVNTQEINPETNMINESDLKIANTAIPGITAIDYFVDDLNEIPSFEFVGQTALGNWKQNALLKLLLNYTYGDYTDGYVFSYNDQLSNILENVTADYPQLKTGTNWKGGFLQINTQYSSFINNVNNARTETTTAWINFLNNYSQNKGNNISNLQIENLTPYLGKYIYNRADSKVYSITLETTNITYNENINPNDLTSFKEVLRNIPFEYGGGNDAKHIYNETSFAIFKSTATQYSYKLTEIGSGIDFNFNFKANQRKLPKSAVRCVNIVSGEGNLTDNDIAQALMLAQTNGINENNDTGRILDIQFLPFSIATTTSEDIKINDIPMLASFLDNDDYQFITDLEDLTNINKETDTIKIVSPSRANQYLFRPYDNNGNMIFNSKITLRPYTSVIYIRPSTRGLLISDWDDKDCLIIEEDFSLTNVSSAWTNYVYQNRNYQNAFERQLQGREFERTWERRVEEAQKASDEWTARNISAQKAQTYTGNIPIISGIAGAIGSAWVDSGYMQAAQVDRQYNEALYQESVNISRDLFTYQLDNLKSQPAIPSKVTTIDCKFLDGVYLEFYSTNESEINAINNYYRYNGNRIDSYGNFNQYWGWFVRGKIIKSNFYTQPEIDEINRRLGMGIFTEVIYGN